MARASGKTPPSSRRRRRCPRRDDEWVDTLFGYDVCTITHFAGAATNGFALVHLDYTTVQCHHSAGRITFVSPVPSIRATRFPCTRSFSPSVRLVFLVRNVRNGHGLAVHVHAVEQTYLDSLVNARNGLALERDPAVPKKRLGFGTLAHAVPARGVWVGWDGRVC